MARTASSIFLLLSISFFWSCGLLIFSFYECVSKYKSNFRSKNKSRSSFLSSLGLSLGAEHRRPASREETWGGPFWALGLFEGHNGRRGDLAKEACRTS
jgi:hypothetical protein